MKNKRTHIPSAFLGVIVAVLAMVSTPVAVSQDVPYKFNAGLSAGMSGYAGDASSSLFGHPGFVAAGSFRYQYDARWWFGGNLSVMSLSGDTSDMDGVRPGGVEYTFESMVYDLGGRVDFNFFPYGMGETYKGLRRWTPYVTAGIGVSLASCSGNTAVGPDIALGVGVRYKLSERWNLGAEFAVTKVFNDHVDGPDLSDLDGIESSFVKNNDWYSGLTVSISYEFGRRCETCHYVE